MAQRKVSILDKAANEAAYVAYFIESEGFPKTAKKFVSEAFNFFNKLGESKIKYKPCALMYGGKKVIAAQISEKSM